MGLLKRRIIAVLVGVLFLALILIAIVLYVSSGNAPKTVPADNELAIGQNLTETQKSQILDVAVSDSILKTELMGSELILTGGNTSEASGNYTAVNISVSEYEDPGSGVSGVLPAVTFIVGTESQEGPTLQAFVDMGEKRVAYIKETWRTLGGRPASIQMINVSIADTGYVMGENLTAEQRSDAAGIALGNRSVKGYLEGKNYTLNGVEISEYGAKKGGSSTRYVYPMVSYKVEPGTMVRAYVDIKGDSVVYVSSVPVTTAPEATGQAK